MNRINALFSTLHKDTDAVLINNYTNRLYFTGFASSAGTVLATRNNAYFIIDSRYYEAAKNTILDFEVVLQNNLYIQLKNIVQTEKIKNIAIDNKNTTIYDLSLLSEKLHDLNFIGNAALSEKIEKMRIIKDQNEIECIKKAQCIADKTFEHIIKYIKEGVTEREIALEIEFFSRKTGSFCNAFDVIAVSGKNSSMPHGVPGDRKIKSGDFITMDFGCTVNGYRSDMTRTVGVGKISDKQKNVYNTVLKAQNAALNSIRAGVVCRDIDKISRDIINKEYNGYFTHGLGHGVGLDIHENPRFNQKDDTVLEKNTVITVEPGIYLPGEFGVRIEDMVLVKDNGCENFTKSTKDIIVV